MIEKSTNGINSIIIAQKQAITNNLDNQQYKYVDNTSAVNNYCRLKFIETDNTISYSNIVFVNSNCSSGLKTSVAPNPVAKNNNVVVTIPSAETGKATIFWYDVNGKNAK
jgi:hypothetical protein